MKAALKPQTTPPQTHPATPRPLPYIPRAPHRSKMKRGNDSEDDYVSDDDYAADNQFEAMPAPVAKKRAPKKAKKVKDPDAPKRPQSAFFLYMNSQRYVPCSGC